MLLSIIVPIYNVEKYLDRCITSIIKQLNDNIEIILINDGSTDKSLLICEQYKNYKNIKIINKSNGGLSDARNVGIKNADGEYLMFLDSDDLLVDNSLNTVLMNIEKYKTDLIYFSIIKSKNNEVKILSKMGISENEIMTGEKSLELELMSSSFLAMAQSIVCRRNFILENNLLFKKEIYHEDEQWTPRVMLKANTIVKIDYSFYKYVIRENSITTTINCKRYFDYLSIVDELKELYLNSNNENIKRFGLEYIVKIYMNSLAHLKKYNQLNVTIDYNFIKENMMGLRNKLKYYIFKISPKLFCRFIDR